eukprot:scaffold422640_cov20-Prasinocladus_malaysianus.AAC.1
MDGIMHLCGASPAGAPTERSLANHIVWECGMRYITNTDIYAGHQNFGIGTHSRQRIPAWT